MYGDIIRIAREKKGYSQEELADLMEIGRVSISNYEKEKNTPTYSNIIKLSTFLDIDAQDLFDIRKREKIAREEIRKNKSLYAPLFPEIQAKDNMIQVSIIPAGAGAEAYFDIELMENIFIEKRLISDNVITKFNANTLAIRVVGNSMEPKISENDILFIDMRNGRNIVQADGVYLVRYGNTVQIKQVEFLGDGAITIISFNKEYKEKTINNDWDILGKPFMQWSVKEFSKLEVL